MSLVISYIEKDSAWNSYRILVRVSNQAGIPFFDLETAVARCCGMHGLFNIQDSYLFQNQTRFDELCTFLKTLPAEMRKKEVPYYWEGMKLFTCFLNAGHESYLIKDDPRLSVVGKYNNYSHGGKFIQIVVDLSKEK